MRERPMNATDANGKEAGDVGDHGGDGISKLGFMKGYSGE